MNPFGTAPPPSKRNSVSPPGWEQSSEEDQPLDFSLSGAANSNADCERRSEDLSMSSTGASLRTPSGSERLSPASTSPQTVTPDSSDAEASDITGTTAANAAAAAAAAAAARGLPPSALFSNSSLQSAFLPTTPAGSLIAPNFSHLYQMVYPPALPQVDASLHASAALLDPNYLHFRQKVLLQKFSQSATGRRKRPSSTSSPPPRTHPAEPSSETSEHSNDSSNIASTSTLQPRVVSPTGTQGTGRRRGKAYPEEMKDEAYWERRRKNNEAAKRSRDARRAKEDETAIRAAFLEDENLKLKVHNAALQSEINKMRHAVYS